MTHVRKAYLTASRLWWKHLRNWKREFWKRERRAAKLIVRGEV